MLIDTLLATNPSSFTMSVFERRLNLRMLYFAKNDRINYPKKQMGV